MRVFFKCYDSKMASREKLFRAAVDFANQVGREQLINITHSEDRDNIVITIWYWAEQEIKPIVEPKKAPSSKGSKPDIPAADNAQTKPAATSPRPPEKGLDATPVLETMQRTIPQPIDISKLDWD